MRGWLGVLSVSMLCPVLILMVIATDAVIPIPVMSTEVTGEVIDVWVENYGGDSINWCKVKFPVGENKYGEASVRKKSWIGNSVTIRYCKDLLGYRATALTNDEILESLITFYIAEAVIIVPAFIGTYISYRKKRRSMQC